MAKKNDFEYIWTDKKRTLFGLPLSFTRYFLTPTKFITRVGFFNLEEDELDLYKVMDKKLKLPFGQRLFGCGTIVLSTKDVDTPIKEIISIKAPREVMRALDDYINDEKNRYNVKGRDVLSANHMPPEAHGDHCDNPDHHHDGDDSGHGNE